MNIQSTVDNTVAIGYADYVLGRQEIPVDEYVCKLSDDFLNRGGENSSFAGLSRSDVAGILKLTTGIKKLCLEERRNEPDILCEIIDRYLQNSKTPAGELDYIIYTKGDPIAGGVNVPYYVQNRFSMTNAQVFCIEQECSATLLAMDLARTLIIRGPARRVLVVSPNFFESFEKRFMGLFLVSDGIGIMELRAGGTGLMPVAFSGRTNGSFNNVQDLTSNASQVVGIGVAFIKEFLEKKGLTVDDISVLIPQNTNPSGWNIYAKQLGIAKSRIFLDNFGGVGHLGDVDMIRNIVDIERANLLPENGYALAYALGTGTSWNAMLLKKG